VVAPWPLEEGRFKFSRKIPLADTFEREVRAFRPDKRITKADDAEYVVWRDSEHDDCVFCGAMAIWLGEMYTPKDSYRKLTEQEGLDMAVSQVPDSEVYTPITPTPMPARSDYITPWRR
jgi:hypothetical protein